MQFVSRKSLLQGSHKSSTSSDISCFLALSEAVNTTRVVRYTEGGRRQNKSKTESLASSPDVHLVRAEAQQGVQHQTGGQVIGLAQLLHTHSSAPVHRLPPSACCRHTGGGRVTWSSSHKPCTGLDNLHKSPPAGRLGVLQIWPRWHFSEHGLELDTLGIFDPDQWKLSQ